MRQQTAKSEPMSQGRGPSGTLMLVGSFYRLLQSLRIHQENNQLVLAGAQDFSRDAALLLADYEEAIILMQRGQLFFQGDKVPTRPETVNLLHNLQLFFGKFGMSGIRLYKESAAVAPRDLAATFRLFILAANKPDPFAALTEKLIESGVFWLEILRPSAEVLPVTIGDTLQDQALGTYGMTLAALKDIGKKVTNKKRSGVGKIIRMVQKITDLIREDENLFLCLSTIRDYDDSIYAHSLNVSLLSMTLGYRIGFSRKVVHRLGICGMFYDFGKLSMPREVLHKHAKLNQEEVALVHMHPQMGVRRIVQLNAARKIKAYSLLSSFEHHLRYDRSGYPQNEGWTSPVSTFGRILAIADVYVALTSYREYRPYTLSPDSAINVMVEGSGREFDPVLLKVFINMMGAFPIGTLLQLDSNQLALVVDCPSVVDSDRPRILILKPDGKGGFTRDEYLDLAERDQETGAFTRNIVSSMNPVVYGIQPMEFLF
jgi:HD-GYP domain-containing protein (c-di-GMP phosphodiesterase class II)